MKVIRQSQVKYEGDIGQNMAVIGGVSVSHLVYLFNPSFFTEAGGMFKIPGESFLKMHILLVEIFLQTQVHITNHSSESFYSCAPGF